ncbi:MAG: SDR family NAD(P)-dependent oxidoreductase [Dehalococcoidia bacterium]
MTEDLLDLKGRIALVTGAGQGVGRAIALTFSRHGAGAVVVNDYFEERAKAVAAEIEALGVRALPIACDVTDHEGVRAMFARARDEAGPVQILVNNAGNMGPEGIRLGPPFWEQAPEDWERSIRVNFYGVLNCVHAALPPMVESRAGSIVTVISDAGRVGEPRLEAYSGAKAGAAGFMRAIAKSIGRFNVRANCVALSTTKTPGVDIEEDSERGQQMLRSYIIRRLGRPEDAAGAVLFLASDAASWVTGQTYAVNGGYAVSM